MARKLNDIIKESNKKEKTSENKKMSDKMASIAAACAALQKRFGKESVNYLGNKKIEPMPRFSSGSVSLDRIMGGGYPCGRIIEIFGPASSGKCLVKETRVLTASGYRTIEEIFRENGVEPDSHERDVPISYPLVNMDGEIESTTHFVVNGVREAYRVRTAGGREITGTAKHPLRTLIEGIPTWKQIGVMEAGDILIGLKDDGQNEEDRYFNDSVESVECIGEVPVFDFAMSRTHSFIAEGIINHNTTLCYHAIAEAQKKFPDGWCGFVDSENCFASGSLIYNAESGTYIPVEQLSGKEISVVSKVGDEFGIQKAIVKPIGEKPIFCISTQRNRKIRLTGNHPVFANGGWKRVDELKPGDVMSSPISIPDSTSGVIADDDEKYRLLGYWIGDGCIEKLEISTVDEFILEDISELCENYFKDTECHFAKNRESVRFAKKDLSFYKITEEFLRKEIIIGKKTILQVSDEIGCSPDTMRRRWYDFGLNREYNLKTNCGRTKKAIPRNHSNKQNYCPQQTSVYKFLSSFDVFHKYSYEAYIPEGLTINQQKHLICGLFLADGTVIDIDKRRRALVSFSSSSYRLCNDIQAVLLKFGIFSTIFENKKKRPNGEWYRINYQLSVQYSGNLKRFYEVFGEYLCGYKKERLEKALSLINQKKHSISNNMLDVKIKSIEPCGTSFVYDVSVANNDYECQNLIVDNLLVHNCFDPSYASNIGVDVSELMVAQPDSGTDAFGMVQGFIENGASLVIVDSVAAMVPREEMEEEDYGKNSIGLQARMMSKGLRKLTAIAGKYKCTVIFTNQTRNKIGILYGNPEVTTGGKALEYYASIRLRVSQCGKKEETVDGEKIVSAIETKVSTVKNKVFAPFKNSILLVEFGKGIDNDAGIIDIAISADIIHKKGGWYAIDGENVAQGMVNLKAYLEEHQDVYDDIKQKVKNHLEKDKSESQSENSIEADLMTDDEIAEKVLSDTEDDTETGEV